MRGVRGEGKRALGGVVNHLGLERRGGSTEYGHSQGRGQVQQRKQHVQRPGGQGGLSKVSVAGALGYTHGVTPEKARGSLVMGLSGTGGTGAGPSRS